MKIIVLSAAYVLLRLVTSKANIFKIVTVIQFYKELSKHFNLYNNSTLTFVTSFSTQQYTNVEVKYK